MEALYFSRSVIPYHKDVPQREWHLRRAYYRHVGMYAYRSDILRQITKLPVSSLEKAESLEQLRWVEAGYKVKCAITHHDSHCIDTPADIPKVIAMMEKARKLRGEA
jgi:3-deoxy-manno-octulosonate cytidylyltransferase (CMP-KDO synthetase)